MSAPRFILRCFVLLGVAAGLSFAVLAALAADWFAVVLGLAWAALGIAIFVGPNDVLARARLRQPRAWGRTQGRTHGR